MEAQIPGPEKSGCGCCGGWWPPPGGGFHTADLSLDCYWPHTAGWLKRKHLVLCPEFAGPCRCDMGVSCDSHPWSQGVRKIFVQAHGRHRRSPHGSHAPLPFPPAPPTPGATARLEGQPPRGRTDRSGLAEPCRGRGSLTAGDSRRSGIVEKGGSKSGERCVILSCSDRERDGAPRTTDSRLQGRDGTGSESRRQLCVSLCQSGSWGQTDVVSAPLWRKSLYLPTVCPPAAHLVVFLDANIERSLYLPGSPAGWTLRQGVCATEVLPETSVFVPKASAACRRLSHFTQSRPFKCQSHLKIPPGNL